MRKFLFISKKLKRLIGFRHCIIVNLSNNNFEIHIIHKVIEAFSKLCTDSIGILLYTLRIMHINRQNVYIVSSSIELITLIEM